MKPFYVELRFVMVNKRFNKIHIKKQNEYWCHVFSNEKESYTPPICMFRKYLVCKSSFKKNVEWLKLNDYCLFEEEEEGVATYVCPFSGVESSIHTYPGSCLFVKKESI